MGYFNVSCGLSGISMSEDEVVLIPLRKPHTNYKSPHDEDGAHIIGNSQANYEVETLPIYGNLNSYGGLENILRDSNVEFIENYYRRDIYEIAEMSSNSYRGDVEANPKSNPQLPVSGIWVNRQIYEEVTKLENFNCYCKDRLRSYQALDIPEDLVLSDDVSKLSIFEIKYYQYLHARKKREESFSDQELIDYSLSIYKPKLCTYFGCNDFIKIYGRNNSNPEIIREYVKFKHFDVIMNCCNKIYGPTVNPLQDGNHLAEKFLHELSLKIIERKLSDYDTNI